LQQADVQLSSKVDASGKTKAIVFSTTATLDVLEVERLCEAVGWPERPREKIKRALENSFMVATLYEVDIDPDTGNRGDTSKGRLIGCARATSDHVFNATLWDIIVDPAYQGVGLGKALVTSMIRSLLARDVANVTLFADQDVIPFYRALGFIIDPEGIKGMFLYPS
jgi:ribosomal protein S18 acetylase RimI-like enzyme